jgi:hypothetical protein
MVFGHRAAIVGATVGDLCEIGNGAILMPGSRLGSGCILGEARCSRRAQLSLPILSWSGARPMSSGRPRTRTASGWRYCASIRPT